MKIRTLMQALDFIGRTCHSAGNAASAEAVVRLLRQADGVGDLTLAEWAKKHAAAASLQTPTLPKARKRAKATVDEAKIARARVALERCRTQGALSTAIGDLGLTAPEWRSFAKTLTGRTVTSGRAARDCVEAHFSDGLLLRERLMGVKRLFGEAVPRFADA